MFDNDQSHLGPPPPPDIRRLDPEEEISGVPEDFSSVAGNLNAQDKQLHDRYAITPKVLCEESVNVRSNAGKGRPVAQCERCQWQVLERDYRPGEVTNRCRECGGLMQLAEGVYSWVDPEEGKD